MACGLSAGTPVLKMGKSLGSSSVMSLMWVPICDAATASVHGATAITTSAACFLLQRPTGPGCSHTASVHRLPCQCCAWAAYPALCEEQAKSTTPAVACTLCCPLVQCHTDEAIGCSGDDVCDAIVDDAREVCTVLIFGPVGEHDRHGGEDLAAEWGRCGHDPSQCGSSPCESATN